MAKQEILYIAYKNESLEEGIDYAIYLSHLLGESLRVVLLSPDGLGKRFNDLMTAVTFAEANEPGMAREFLLGSASGGNGKRAAAIQSFLVEKCRNQGIAATVHIGLEAKATVILNFLKQKKVDLVLLSPAVTNNGHILKRLVKFSPRPVVTMARGANQINSQLKEEAV